jgi:hypothetical protein
MGVGAVPARDGLIGWTRPVRVRDQEEEPEGELVCRIVEDKNGGLHVLDSGRLRLRARRSKDGVLEIHHSGEETDDARPNPDVTGTGPALGGDPAAATGRTGDALAAWHRSGGRSDHMAGLAALQRKIDEHYGTR